MTIVQEKERKTLHVLKLCGLQSFPYWLGLFLADYILYLIQATVLILIASFIGLCPFANYGILVGSTLALGAPYIIFSYLISQRFETQETAVRANWVIQIGLGLITPVLLMVLPVNFLMGLCFFFYLSFPLCTYFMTLLSETDNFVGLQSIIFFNSVELTLGLCIGIFALQFAVYTALLFAAEYRQN